MANWETLLAFAMATAVFAYIPGPALLYTAAQTVARGRRAGLMAALGIHVGCYAHVLAAAFGLSAIFRHVPEAYLALKVVGALYLVWLGVEMMLNRGETGAPAEAAPRSQRAAFVQSMIVEILNPKVAIFFIAFLPQFVDPAAAAPVWAQFLVLGVIVNLAFSSADVITVFAAAAVMAKARGSRRGARVMRVAGGSIMVALGVKLATDKA